MTTRRPLRLVFGLLALAGVSKLALAAVDHGLPQLSPSLRDSAAWSLVTPASADTDTETAALAECPVAESDTPEELLAGIAAERALIEAQRATLAQRAAEIELASEMLAAETAHLEELKDEVEQLLERASVEHDADIDRLIALYANMKPREAAEIMNDLDLEVMVSVLGTMTERDAAPIMAALAPVRARALSLILHERARFPGDRRLDRVRLD